MTTKILTVRRTPDGKYTIGYGYYNAPAFRSFYIELPSGLRHWFTDAQSAIGSQYWPWRN